MAQTWTASVGRATPFDDIYPEKGAPARRGWWGVFYYSVMMFFWPAVDSRTRAVGTQTDKCAVPLPPGPARQHPERGRTRGGRPASSSAPRSWALSQSCTLQQTHRFVPVLLCCACAVAALMKSASCTGERVQARKWRRSGRMGPTESSPLLSRTMVRGGRGDCFEAKK